MKMKLLAASVLAAATALATMPAQAALNVPVPGNAYITFGGLNWAWANPCAPSAPTCGGIDLTYQATQGWRLPTAAELLAGPSANDFLFAGANVPAGGVSAEGTQFFNAPSAGACATAYFGTTYNHCDFSDGLSRAIYGDPRNPFGPTDALADTWLVRASGGVPEPATWGLMILGFGAIGGAMRRRAVRASVRFA